MDFKLPEKVVNVFTVFQKAGFEIYIVGGAVRDLLTGKPVYDWDFTTNATPEQILKLFPDAYYDNQFGTVGIKPEVENERPLEITTFRTESSYSDSRRPDKVTWGKTLEEDLKRRDFTINAMALNVHLRGSRMGSSEVIDMFGGQEDLKKKIIRAVGDPNERFGEDALRMMRAVRIATQLNFAIEENTLEAIKNHAPTLQKIAKERVKEELFKILSSHHVYEGILLFRLSGLMAQVLPEMERAFGVEQKSPGRHHIYDVGTHLLMSLKAVAEKSNDPVTRLATLIHDIGKPQTYRKLETGTITFYNHEMVSTKIAERIAERLKFSNAEADKLTKLVRWHQFTVSENQTDSAIRRFIKNVTLQYVEDAILLRIGDRLGGGARETSWRLEEFKKRIIEVQKQPFAVRDLKINGRDVMQILQIPAGPRVGEVLQKLFNAVVAGKLKNDRPTLLTAIKKL